MTRQATIAVASAFALLLIGTLPGRAAANLDSDADGVADDEDNCVELANPDQLDTNWDGYGNACDADYDNDGYVDEFDLDLLKAAYGAREGDRRYDPDIDCQADGIINLSDFVCFKRSEGLPLGPSGLACAGMIPCIVDADGDKDGDGVRNLDDNCVEFANPDQLDTNRNGYGNACDADYDDSGHVDQLDLDLFKAAYGASEGDPGYDPDIDCQGDGRINLSDFVCFKRGEGRPPGPSGLTCAGTTRCPRCDLGFHYEHDGSCHENVAEYVVRLPSGKYQYNGTSPWPSDVQDENWITDEEAFPFATIDSMTTLQTSGLIVFTSGDQYVLWNGTSQYHHYDDNGNRRPGAGTIEGSSWWVRDAEPGFPFDSVDAMMEMSSGLQVFTHGGQYVLWSADNGYHHYDDGNQETGAGEIMGSSWWHGDNFPYDSIDAMERFVDPNSGNDVAIIVSGRDYVRCDLPTPTDYDSVLCESGADYQQGTLGDTFWRFRWQRMPFLHTGLDAMLRWDDRLLLTSNTPLRRAEVAGRFVIAAAEDDEDTGPDQRILYLHGSDPYEKGYAHGYILAQEILDLHNSVIKPWYDEALTSVTVRNEEGDEPEEYELQGYELAMHLAEHWFNPNDLDKEGETYYQSYYQELQGLRAGVLANPFVIPRMDDEDTGRIFEWETSHLLEWTDLMATLIIDDLMGTTCKAVAVWPKPGYSVDQIYHAYAMEWFPSFTDYNILIVYDNREIAPLTWVGTSLSGHIGGFLYAMNEKGMSFAGVAADWALRSCASSRPIPSSCLQFRLDSLAGAPEFKDEGGDIDVALVPGSLLARHTVETAIWVEDGYNRAFAGANMGTTYGLHAVSPATVAGLADPPVGAYEIAYVNIGEVWPADSGDLSVVFDDDDGYANTELREYNEPSSRMCEPDDCTPDSCEPIWCPADMCGPDECADGECDAGECARYVCDPDECPGGDCDPEGCAGGICADGGACPAVLPILVVTGEDPLRKSYRAPDGTFPWWFGPGWGHQAYFQTQIGTELKTTDPSDSGITGDDVWRIMKDVAAGADASPDNDPGTWVTTQFVLANPSVDGDLNTSEIVVSFAHDERPEGGYWYALGEDPSVRHYSWSEIFELVGAE